MTHEEPDGGNLYDDWRQEQIALAMDPARHSALPWKVSDRNEHGDLYIGNDEEHHIVIVEGPALVARPTLGNAEFIVRAVNAHDDLLAALEAVVHDRPSAHSDDVWLQAAAALAKAKAR